MIKTLKATLIVFVPFGTIILIGVICSYFPRLLFLIFFFLIFLMLCVIVYLVMQVLD